ncbi:MAG: hypothetical protein ACE5DP_01525 [Fidelibacterota bacterium]
MNRYDLNMRSWVTLAPKFLWTGVAIFLFFQSGNALRAQDDFEEPVEIFWGDEEDTSAFFEEDTLYGEEGFAEDTLFEDEYLDEYFDEGLVEDTGAFGDEGEFIDEETEAGGEELSDVELADVAQRLGYSLSISGASPGFVNHALTTYNNNPQVVYRIALEFPLLMQIKGTRFRFGVEAGTFGFQNYMPIGGKYSGMTLLGILSFPAGPGQVKLGAGLVGKQFGFSAETTYGLALGNTLEIRVGVRSTTASKVIDTVGNDLGTVSWLDGVVTLGFNL